jgi:hypothetical protein
MLSELSFTGFSEPTYGKRGPCASCSIGGRSSMTKAQPERALAR